MDASTTSQPEAETKKPLKEGWYEFIAQPEATTEIAHIGESGLFYCPTRGMAEKFIYALNHGQAHRLVREEEQQ